MAKQKIETHIIKATITKEQRNMVDRLLATGKFISESEVIRQAILIFYAKIRPGYLEPTAAALIKKKKMEKDEVVANMPDEEFVAKNLEDVMIYTDTENKKWVLTRGRGNSIVASPLDGIKDWVVNPENPWYGIHKMVANTNQNPYEWFLKYNESRKYLAQRFGVAIKYDPKVNGGIYDEELGAVRPE